MSEERIAQRIKNVRTTRKLTLQDLADLTGLGGSAKDAFRGIDRVAAVLFEAP